MKKLIKMIFGKTKNNLKKIEELNKTNSFKSSMVNNKNGFLTKLINTVPNGTIWSIEGIENTEILKCLDRYKIEDEYRISRNTIWPKQKMIRVKLDSEAKNFLNSKIPNWDLDVDIIHQHLYFKDKTFFTSYDNMHEDCTMISNRLSNIKESTIGIVKFEE